MLRKATIFFGVILSFSLTAQPQILPAEQSEIIMTPILHATMVLQWNGVTVYLDPYGGADRFADFPNADLILITHVHGDHLNHETLVGLDLSKTELMAPESVAEKLGDITFGVVHTMANDEQITSREIGIKAVPMYNLPETNDSRHPKGKGNGYVLTMGGKRLYISGDTEDIPEMRSLHDIDYAFVCMNLPYTMDVEAAASAVIDFKPKVVFPFHFRGGGGIYSDVAKFKELVEAQSPAVEVKILNWYPDK